MAQAEEKAKAPAAPTWPRDATITFQAEVWKRVLSAMDVMVRSVNATMYENAYQAMMVDLVALRPGETHPARAEVMAINGVSVLRWTRLCRHDTDPLKPPESAEGQSPLLGRVILSSDSLQRMIQAVKDVLKRFGRLQVLQTADMTLDMRTLEFKSELGSVKLWEETRFGYPLRQDGKFPVNAMEVAVKSHGDLPPCSTPIGLTGRFITEAVQMLHLATGENLKKSKKGVILHTGQTPTSAMKLIPAQNPFEEDETVVVYMMPMRV